jgi:VanZ family protein
MRPATALLPAALYAAVIFYLSSQAHPLAFLPPEVLLQDKLLHLLEYAALAALLVPGLRLVGVPVRATLLAAVGLASLYGLSDEFHQSFVPGRDADVLDWVADTSGGVLGAIGASALLALRRPGGAG